MTTFCGHCSGVPMCAPWQCLSLSLSCLSLWGLWGSLRRAPQGPMGMGGHCNAPTPIRAPTVDGSRVAVCDTGNFRGPSGQLRLPAFSPRATRHLGGGGWGGAPLRHELNTGGLGEAPAVCVVRLPVGLFGFGWPLAVLPVWLPVSVVGCLCFLRHGSWTQP